MRYIIILIILMKTLFSLDVVLDVNESSEYNKNSKRISDKSKQYFGENLFSGNFKNNREFKYNPNYIVNINDKLSVKMWGVHDYLDDNLTVDKQGNIFIPEVGVVHLLGVRADEVQQIIEDSVKDVFNDNVHVYADVKQYQVISIFVSGSVKNAGLYNGLSTDSILQFIDKAGGIISGEGSYRDIEILRNHVVVKKIDLYNFLVTGDVESFQFRASDVILVKPVDSFISVLGDVVRPYFFELSHENSTVQEVMHYILPKPTINNFIITSWVNRREVTKEYPLEQASSVYLKKGDSIKFYSNYYIENIEVTIEGEHIGTNHISVSKGTTLYDILSKVDFTPLSDIENIHFYRKKVADMQQKLLDSKLNALESKILTRDASTKEEAEIYKSESEQISTFIKRARAVKQKGQVILRLKNNLKKIVLENNDRISIPKKNNIVLIQGEVAVPNALAYDSDMKFSNYIDFCGGFTEDADLDRILLIKANGRVLKYNKGMFNKELYVDAGDSILVLQKVRTKNMLIFKDLTQILYQIAVGAAVILQL